MRLSNDPKFTGRTPIPMADKLSKASRPIASFIALEEAESGLSHVRFIQDTVTNWVPKAVFSRSKADFSEMSFLEISESLLVYYCPTLLGEKLFRKMYSGNLSDDLKKLVSKPAAELLKEKNIDNAAMKKLLPVKAAIALSCMAIPLTELSLNYTKNLLTLKLFKKADFNNIANLNKDQKESKNEQEKVKKSAVKHIKMAAVAYGACLATSALLLARGHKSKALQNLSELILAPGSKLFSKNSKAADFFNKYFSIDFADNAGKLTLSRGQLASCVGIGAIGYFGAAKDRGKQNFLEVLSRYPLVGFYVITGSELFEKGFKKLLHSRGVFKDLINEKLEVPKLKDLSKLAAEVAGKKGTNTEDEFKKLFKQKSIVTGVPFLFSMGVMGFFVAGMARFWTEHRYKKEAGQKAQVSHVSNSFQNIRHNPYSKFYAQPVK